MWFDSWHSLWSVLLKGVVAYLALVLILRLSGKRTLSKMNAFDFVVTVALGSTLASTILGDRSLTEGVAALALLIGFQYVITWSSVRWQWFQGLVKSQPTLVFFQGEFLDAAMTAERVTTEEVRDAIRAQGHASTESIAAVVLETDGSFTVVRGLPEGAASALANVGGTGDRLDTGGTVGPVARRADA